jgi:AcrR family transcriptional regulator
MILVNNSPMARPAADREEVRIRILDAAEQLLGQRGYRRMTIDDLAASAGLSKGAVYLHFESKEEIVLARIDRVIGDLLVALERMARSHRPANERLRDMLLLRVLYRLERVRTYRDTIDQVVAAIRPRLLVARRKHHQREAKLFEEVLRDGIRRQEFRACSAKRVSEALVVATNALLPADLRPDEMDASEIRQRVATIADLLIHGLVPARATP